MKVPASSASASTSQYWEPPPQKPVKSIIFTGQPAILAVLLLAFGLAPRVRAQVQVDDHNPVGVTGAFEGVIATGCGYNVLNHSTSRAIDDIVVPGSIGKYPLKMTRYYTSRRFGANGLGPGWSYEYFWQLSGAGYKVLSPHGDVHDFSCGRPLGESEGWDDGIQGQHQNGGTWRLADGGKVNFNSNYFATYIEDPYGQRTTIEYTNGYPTKVTEPGGRYLKFIWGESQLYTMGLLLTRVEAHGLGNATVTDWVNYTYTAKPTGGVTYTQMKVLTSVTYSDNTSATYAYEPDNAPDQPHENSYKIYPLVSTCNDVRYHGPMRRIAFDYQNGGPHGAITAERYSPSDGNKGVAVSSISPNVPSPVSRGVVLRMPTDFTETRGDGPTRAFHYTDLSIQRPTECCDRCPDITGPAPSQFLRSYTDFQNHTTQLGYDANWFVNSITDANTHTTYYTRGAAPNSIGEITQVKHPDTATINYDYYRNGNIYDPHYLTSITDERGNITYHTRDGNHRITGTDYKDAGGNIIASDAFVYNSFGQVITHQLKNGAYESFTYDGRGLLTDKYNPKFNAIPGGADPHTHYDYYTSGAWTDRVKIMTLPANVNGNVATETYQYDLSANNTSRGLVTSIQHADLKYQSFGYDAYGNKLWEENELRNHTSYTYDEYNRVLTVKDPIGRITNHTTTYTYNPTNGSGSRLSHTTNNPDTVTTPTGILTTNDYDQNFRKESTTVGSSITRFGYDYVGNPTTVTDPLTHTTTTDYDTRNRKWHVWDALTQRTIFGYDPASNVTSITRPDNRVETKAYDAMNRLIRQTVPKSGTESLTTTFGYWPSGKLFWVQDPKQQGGGVTAATYFEYNESDQQIRMWYPGQTEKQEWTYDNAHNLVSHTTVGGKIEQFTYDIRNRKDTMICATVNPVVWIEWADYGYDDVGRLTYAQNGTGPWNPNNPISTVTRQYDDGGRLISDQQNVNGLGPVNVSYPWYDDDGKLKRVFVPGATYDYTYDYDTMGRFWTISTGGSVAFKYHYDDASNETQRDNLLNGVIQIYNPDNLNRIWRLDVKKGASLLGREDYGYDVMNRLVSITREDNKQDQYGYWWDGELLGVAYGADPTPTPSPPASPTPTPPGGQVATPTFAPGGGNIYPNHNVTVAISTATTGAQIRYTLDGANWTTIANGASIIFAPGIGKTLTAIGFKSGMADSDPHSAEYYYDNGGSPGADKSPPPKSKPPATDPGNAKTAGNLWHMAPGNPDRPEAAYRAVVYYYDGAGNRTSANDNGIITTYAPNPLNEYDTVTGSTISNGPEHEIRAYSNVNYSYLSDKHLVSVSSGSNSYALAYDALGRCVKRTLNGATTYYIYDGEKPILEYTTNPIRIVARNVYGKGIDEILMRTATGINGNQPFYYQQDHEGSVTHLTNGAGTVIEKYRYDAFGVPVTIYSAGTYNNRFKFTGREFNSTFGFYEYRARAYSPILGRFMSEDPKLFDAGDYNLFRYCHNDPIDFTDPMGTLEQYHDELAHSSDRLWEMTKWFDRSNLVQGNFPGFGLTLALTDQQAKRPNGMRVERAIPVGGQRDPLLSTRTENNLATLAQPVRDMARSLLYHARVDLHLEVQVIQGTRTYAEQNALYAQGRTAPGPIVTNASSGYSFHNFGVAFDVGIFRGRSYVEGGSGYTSVGHLGERTGLEWGGRWRSFQDTPHFQYPGLNLDTLRSRVGQGLSPIPGY
jgi:RHS repeat-associated protein